MSRIPAGRYSEGELSDSPDSRVRKDTGDDIRLSWFRTCFSHSIFTFFKICISVQPVIFGGWSEQWRPGYKTSSAPSDLQIERQGGETRKGSRQTQPLPRAPFPGPQIAREQAPGERRTQGGLSKTGLQRQAERPAKGRFEGKIGTGTKNQTER